MAEYRTRFAPSPTGWLHLGHAYSALTAAARARAAGGTFLLRIEDTDRTRVRPEYEAAIYEDLAWLGLTWPQPVLRQSARTAAYDAALTRLESLGVLYPCGCTRGDIRAALSAPQEGVAFGPDGPVYPGTCRGRAMAGRGPQDAIRLNMRAAIAHLGDVARLEFTETGPECAGLHRPDAQTLTDRVGDIVLARRDIGPAYHLAVVVDDAAQAITEVVRGADLFDAVQIHRLLQALLDLPVPVWHHHRLIRDEAGRRLAKRDDARAIRSYRAAGASPEDIRRMIFAE